MTILKQLEPEKEIGQTTLRPNRLTLIAGFGLVALIVLEIWVSHTTAIFGAKFKELQNLQDRLTLENQILEDQIASASALRNIASQSAQLGLVTPSNVEYIR